ncbi:hypothetical protein ACFCX4_34810 [Kitasatospora sp. NPDC056327]|uniref:hypothetical protein n=1 Tax=Kitasatospora sp. NPDC056327 TaxID=3345785 RepID=UPI0035D8E66E
MFATVSTAARPKAGAVLAAALLCAALGGFAAPSSSAAPAGPATRAAQAASSAPSVSSAPSEASAQDGRGPVTPSVRGSVRVAYVYSPDDDIRFVFDVEAAPFSRPLEGIPRGLPTDARGTVRISHHVAALGRTVTSEAAVDCLVTGDGAASFTAVVVRADPEVADTVGRRQGFSVLDGGGHGRSAGPDRVGFSWGVANLDTDGGGRPVEGRVGTCMAPAPFTPVVEGSLAVRHAGLPPLPAGSGPAVAR